MLHRRLIKISLLLGDIVILYLGLFLALTTRYGSLPSRELWSAHAVPFLIINLVFIAGLYISGLYDFERPISGLELKNLLFKTLLALFFVSVILFYLAPIYGITPKTTLVLFFLAAGTLMYIWRISFNYFSRNIKPINKIILFGKNKNTEELVNFLKKYPYLGYEIILWTDKEGLYEESLKNILEGKNNANCIIVVASHIKKDSESAKTIYKNLLSGVQVVDFCEFYESIFKKIPLDEMEEVWFLENIINRHKFYDSIKRPVEFLMAVVLMTISLPILILISLLTKITSGSPVMLKQIRIGRNGRKYKHYKIRTMAKNNSDTPSGSNWISKDDPRVTRLGRILRSTRLDELPQIYNIIRGDLSFIGPRPDFIDFYEILEKEIPYYSIRNVVKPGLSGWAQVNNKYGGSVEQSKERLAYEIYYLKNRSLFLDIVIIAKTIKTILSASGV